MMVWWKPDQKEKVEFHAVTVSQTGRVKEEKVETDKELDLGEGQSNAQLQIHRVWEASEGVYMIYCDTTAPPQEDGTRPSGLFVYDTVMSTFREARCDFQAYNGRVVDHFTLG